MERWIKEINKTTETRKFLWQGETLDWQPTKKQVIGVGFSNLNKRRVSQWGTLKNIRYTVFSKSKGTGNSGYLQEEGLGSRW